MLFSDEMRTPEARASYDQAAASLRARRWGKVTLELGGKRYRVYVQSTSQSGRHYLGVEVLDE
jgi:hypothetical protein